MPGNQGGAADQAMPGMQMPAEGSSQPTGNDMSAMPGMTANHTMQGHGNGGTALPPGNASAPAPPTDHFADRVYAPIAMAAARNALRREHGGENLSMVLFNLAEYQVHNGRDGYRWDGEAWVGGDINRLALKTEGEGSFGRGVDSAEIQALYSRALDPYWNLQAGVRYDFKPNPSRTYATIGFEGLAPGFFEVAGALFLSNKGDVLGRLEGYYDQRITQRLILQPRVELNFAAQNVDENRIGSGLSTAELGVRLRYEVAREFAPYIGVSYDRKVGKTADYARADGKGVKATSFVVGARTWF
jgi:copper resistance protein B